MHWCPLLAGLLLHKDCWMLKAFGFQIPPRYVITFADCTCLVAPRHIMDPWECSKQHILLSLSYAFQCLQDDFLYWIPNAQFPFAMVLCWTNFFNISWPIASIWSIALFLWSGTTAYVIMFTKTTPCTNSKGVCSFKFAFTFSSFC